MFTFATIYDPNTNQLTFLDTVLEQLLDFKEGSLILGGDFTVSPDPLLDTSHRRPSHSHAFLKHFRKALHLQSHFLMDSWRVLHPSEKDFSYYSNVYNVYTRIDLLCVDHPILELLQLASIGNITIADHAPVLITLALPSGTHRAWLWRLNENLLDGTVVVLGVTDVLTHYFSILQKALAKGLSGRVIKQW